MSFEKLARDFTEQYIREGIKAGFPPEQVTALMDRYFNAVKREMKNPTPFSIYHEAKSDEKQFGLDMFQVLVDLENSNILGQDQLKAISEKIERGENVILLANHQTEPDPQAITLALKREYPRLSNEMIFVAGDRVVRDPMAIPLSLGCNLLCIFSKKYIDTPPEKREEKLLHNKRTLNKMEELLKEGGKVIYVAASGGRDRKDDNGVLLPAPFTPESVELLHLIARKSGSKTSFHTLALKTYDLLPPPSSLNIHLGEERLPVRTPIYLYFGKELDLEVTDVPRHEIRKIRTQRAYDDLLNNYAVIDKLSTKK